MKKLFLFLITGIIPFIYCSCSDSRPAMKEWNDNLPRILIDENTGKKYVVEHDTAEVYKISPIISNQ